MTHRRQVMQLSLTAEFSTLGMRRELWKQRFEQCLAMGHPERVVACTKRFRNESNNSDLWDEWVETNECFKTEVLGQIVPFLLGASLAVELFVGPGMFYTELIKLVENSYGFDLNQATID